MKKFYFRLSLFFIAAITLLPKNVFSQACNLLTATYVTTESRCEATGTVEITAAGGSGTYQYKATGPVVTNYTTSNLITGLSAGKYLITVKDVVTNCVYSNDTVTIDGDYMVPNFTMISTDVTCINGDDGTISVTGQSFGRAPFSYKIVAPSASGIGTISTSGAFTGLTSGNYLIQLSDSCGAIQTRGVTINNYDWWIKKYTVTKLGCDSITVKLTLTDNKGNTTPNAIFNGFMYGISTTVGDTAWFSTNVFTYYVGSNRTAKFFVKDNCGNLKWVTWSDKLIPGVNATVLITDKECSTFTATITGQVNLTNALYCIYDTNKVQLACNTTGIFTMLSYNTPYCIDIKDDCYDTTISRCFIAERPRPSVSPNVQIVTSCKGFTVTVSGQSFLNNANYCLYDTIGNLIVCDSSGIFYDLPFGSYCIKIFNNPACYDTVITRCFTVNRPIPTAGIDVTITNLTCTTFTATIGDTANLNNPQFCLYTQAGVLIICNSTGIFNGLLYGTYCIKVINNPSCYDTTITRCFTVNRPIPSVGAVSIIERACMGFTAKIVGQAFLNNPVYCLYDSVNVLIGCNTFGTFSSLPFGSYCITIKNDPSCYDTIIRKCFTVLPTPAEISLTAKKSCVTLGTTDIKVNINSGFAVYKLTLLSPTGAVLQIVFTYSNTYTFTALPALAASLQYRVAINDQCGTTDTVGITPVVSRVKPLVYVSQKCPSGIWPNGSADVVVNVSDNNIGGNIVPKIIKKDGVTVNINASLVAGYKYTFLNLGPATYVFDTYVEDCNKHVYDTVVVRIYLFPILTGTNAYQCDNNGFNVSVHVAGGIGPYTYEIIGSEPALPSIVSAPQASPVFAINNGTVYSLVRLRVVDACGNASLYDVSVLPLANFLVFADTLPCFNQSFTLRVDSIANAQFTWYKRIEPNDSIIVGTGASLYFANLAFSDTGRYFCKIVVGSGCLIRYANYVVTGFCGVLPANDITLKGTKQTDGNKLEWHTGLGDIKEWDLQKSANGSSGFKSIKILNHTPSTNAAVIDKNPVGANNYYRLKITAVDNSIKYSNVVVIKNSKFQISVYPNPVQNKLSIAITSISPKNYLVEISTISGQKILSKTYSALQNQVIEYIRNEAMGSGLYLLTVTDLQTKEKQTYKLLYK